MCMLEAYFWFYAKLNINNGLAFSYNFRLQKADWKPKPCRFYLDFA